MTRTIAYYKDGDLYETYKFVIGNIRKILVKKNGKPYQVVRFNIIDGIKWLGSIVNDHKYDNRVKVKHTKTT